MPITQILLTATAVAGEPPPPPPPTPQGSFLYNGNFLNYGFYGPDQNGPLYETSVTFASTNSTGDQHRFLGDSYMTTSELTGLTTSFYMNLWFYPTANNQIVATMQGVQTESTGYTCTLLEIDTLSRPVVGFWPQHPLAGSLGVPGGGSGALVIGDTVNFNTWNHIYLYNNGTNTVAQLNGGSVFSVSASWASNALGSHFVGFGAQSPATFGASARFTGRIGAFECSSSVISSNYSATKDQYQPSIRLGLDASYNPAYISAEYVLADEYASFGYGADGLAIFSQQDITQGLLSNVGVGWTVENDSGFTATILTRGEFGYAGAIRINTPSWQPGPYTFKPPTNIWRSTNDTYRYLTLFNTPAYTEGPPAYFSFDPASLEYGTAQNLGNLSRWTVEVWFRVTSSLNGYTTMIVGNQFDGVNRLNFHIGTTFPDSPNYNINTGFFDGAWRRAGDFNPSLNTWYHVVGTYDGNFVTQYVNGFQDGQTAYVGTPQSGGQVYVAKRWDSVQGSFDHFPGDIGQATIYAGAMTADEVFKRWNATKSTYGL